VATFSEEEKAYLSRNKKQSREREVKKKKNNFSRGGIEVKA